MDFATKAQRTTDDRGEKTEGRRQREYGREKVQKA